MSDPIRGFIEQFKDKALEYVQERRAILKHPPLDKHSYFKGYTSDEIDVVMRYQQVAFLPELYRQLLVEMGHSFDDELGPLYIATFEELSRVKQQLISNVAYAQNCSQNFQLPDDVFVFASTYEDDWFFETHEKHDDPPVYFYHECFNSALKVSDSLSEWLMIQAFFDPSYWVRKNMVQEMVGAWSHLDDETDDDVPF